MTEPRTFTGARVKAFREDHALTQADLGHKLGVIPNTIAKWERGAQPIRHPRMVELALQALGARLTIERRYSAQQETPE